MINESKVIRKLGFKRKAGNWRNITCLLKIYGLGIPKWSKTSLCMSVAFSALAALLLYFPIAPVLPVRNNLAPDTSCPSAFLSLWASRTGFNIFLNVYRFITELN